jgi:agmatinase
MTSVQLIGVPFDDKSSFMKGAARGPDAIRMVLHDGSSNYTAENGVDIINDLELRDTGNIEVKGYTEIEEQLADCLKKGEPALFLGGDHSITYPIIKVFNKLWGEFDIIHFDAHSDLYDEFENDIYSHACPFARIMEENLAKRLIQIGIRTLNQHQTEQAVKFGVEIITMQEIIKIKELTFQRDLYLSIDLDGFDPAYAPGVSHYEPGGLAPREVINFIHSLNRRIIGADIVELNPVRDINGITAVLGAKLLKEIMGKIASFAL